MLTLKKIMNIRDRFTKVAGSKNYLRVVGGAVALQIALLILSLLYIHTALFFACLKSLLVISIFRIVVERTNKDTYWPLDWLVVVPGIWAAIYGFSNGNIGAKNELAVFVMAPIVYLLVFLRPAPSLLKHMELSLKVIGALNLLVFFFLYFTESGSLHSWLKDATLFRIQYPEGYIKVNTLQVTPLIFLLPALAGYYYFRQTLVNFVLITAAILMALLSGRKAVLLLFIALAVFAWLYHLYRYRNLKVTLKLALPCLLALIIFPQIATFDNSKFSGVLFDSFSGPDGLVMRGGIGGPMKSGAGEQAAFSHLYNLPSNVCALENYLAAGVAPDKQGPAVRSAQMNTLRKEISARPLFGSGIGYVSADCVRSAQQPWRFELSYLGMALNIGIFGMAIFVLVYLRWLKIALWGSIPPQMTVPLVCGSIFFLICSATNPYILSVEYLWIYFIPFLLSRLVQGLGVADLSLALKR
jgi:hypothetical protein